MADHKIGMMVLSFMDYLFLILFLEFLMFYFYQVVSFVFYLHLFMYLYIEDNTWVHVDMEFLFECST